MIFSKKFGVVFFILPLIVILLNSCDLIYRTCFGIKKEKSYIDISVIKKFAKKNEIDTFYTIKGGYNQLYIENYRKSNDFFQPLQVRIYDSANDSMIGIIVNCKVGGFPNLTWNRYGFFDSLPPKKIIRYDSLTTFKSDKNYLRNIVLKDSLYYPLTKQKRYTVLVYFSYYMNKQSKRLIELVRESYSKYDNVKIEYINSDRLLTKIKYPDDK